MGEKQNKDVFQEDKVSQTYNVLMIAVLLLVIFAAGAHFVINNRQANVTKVALLVETQSMLTGRIYALVSQCQAFNGECQLEDLRKAASTAMTNHDLIAPALLGSLSYAIVEPPLPDALNTVRDFIVQAMSFAASPQSPTGKEAVQVIMTHKDVPLVLDAIAGQFTLQMQKQNMLFVLSSMTLYLLIMGLVFYAQKLFTPVIACIKQQRASLEHVSAVDILSGVYNRAMLFRVAANYIGTYKRQQAPLTVLVIDIDDLQKTNDAHGRAAGDALIKKVAATLGEALRTSDVIGRIGGGEFAVFLPSIDEYRSLLVAEKCRAAIEAMHFEGKYSMILASVSIGVAEMTANHQNPDAMIRSAEEALRRAKAEGRNRVFAYSKVDAAA